MRDIGLEQYVVRIGDVTEETLRQKFSMLLSERESVRRKIEKYRERAYLDRSKMLMELRQQIYRQS